MPNDAERETLLVSGVLLREFVSGCAVGRARRTVRGEGAETIEATRAAALGHSLWETRGSSVTGGLLLLLGQLLLVGATG